MIISKGADDFEKFQSSNPILQLIWGNIKYYCCNLLKINVNNKVYKNTINVYALILIHLCLHCKINIRGH